MALTTTARRASGSKGRLQGWLLNRKREVVHSPVSLYLQHNSIACLNRPQLPP